MDVIEIATETTKRYDEKREGRGLSPAGYFVAEARRWVNIPSLLLRVSEQMA